MAALYLDEDVSQDLPAFLIASEHDVISAYSMNLRSVTDDRQLLEAAHRGRVFVTHNRKDFRLLHSA